MTNKHHSKDVFVSFLALCQIELCEELSLGSARRNARGCQRMARHAKHKISKVTDNKASFEMTPSGVILDNGSPSLVLS